MVPRSIQPTTSRGRGDHDLVVLHIKRGALVGARRLYRTTDTRVMFYRFQEDDTRYRSATLRYKST